MVPALPKLMVLFNVPDSVILQTGTVAELGKFFGSMGWGIIGDNVNTLKMITHGVEFFIIAAAAMFIWIVTLPVKSIIPFFVIFLIASIASNVAHFSLTVIRLINTPEESRKWMTIDAITGGFTHSSILIFGSYLTNKFGFLAPFIFIIIQPCLARLAFCFTIRPKQLEICAVKSRFSGHDEFGGYFNRVIHLLYSRKQRQYQAFLLVLATSSATTTVFPATMTLLFVRYGALQEMDSEFENSRNSLSAMFVSICLFAMTLVQLGSFFLLKYVSSKQFVTVGLAFLAGGGILLMLFLLTIKPSIIQLLVPGIILMIGTGFCAPYCKAGALNAVNDDLASTATSLMKICQIAFTIVISFITNFFFNGTAWPMAIVFSSVNICIFILFFVLLSQVDDDNIPKIKTDEDNIEACQPLLPNTSEKNLPKC